MRATVKECAIELYLTIQDITKLTNLKLCMEERIGNEDYLDSNTAYVLLSTILNALEKKQ